MSALQTYKSSPILTYCICENNVRFILLLNVPFYLLFFTPSSSFSLLIFVWTIQVPFKMNKKKELSSILIFVSDCLFFSTPFPNSKKMEMKNSRPENRSVDDELVYAYFPFLWFSLCTFDGTFCTQFYVSYSISILPIAILLFYHNPHSNNFVSHIFVCHSFSSTASIWNNYAE